jgi:hypothetical protein
VSEFDIGTGVELSIKEKVEEQSKSIDKRSAYG